MLSFSTFKKNMVDHRLLIEGKFDDNYYVKSSYETLLSMVNNNKFTSKKNIFFLTKNSEHSNGYSDEYEYPVTIYFDKMKLYKFIKDNKYNSSLDKKYELIKEAIGEDDFDQLDLDDDSIENISDDDLLSSDSLDGNDEEENNDSSEDQSKDDDEDEDDEITNIEDLPDEISVNEKTIDIDALNTIKILEIDFERMSNLLDNEVNILARMLKCTPSIKKKNYADARLKLAEKFKEILTQYTEKNNIIINFIE